MPLGGCLKEVVPWDPIVKASVLMVFPSLNHPSQSTISTSGKKNNRYLASLVLKISVRGHVFSVVRTVGGRLSPVWFRDAASVCGFEFMQ